MVVNLLKNVIDGAWQYSILFSNHGISLASACLAVGENTSTHSVKYRIDDWQPNFLKDQVLVVIDVFKNEIEGKVALLEVSPDSLDQVYLSS